MAGVGPYRSSSRCSACAPTTVHVGARPPLRARAPDVAELPYAHRVWHARGSPRLHGAGVQRLRFAEPQTTGAPAGGDGGALSLDWRGSVDLREGVLRGARRHCGGCPGAPPRNLCVGAVSYVGEREAHGRPRSRDRMLGTPVASGKPYAMPPPIKEHPVGHDHQLAISLAVHSARLDNAWAVLLLSGCGRRGSRCPGARCGRRGGAHTRAELTPALRPEGARR